MKVKNGIEIIEPNENLSKIYLKKSEEALKVAATIKHIKDWEISSLYYSMYFALYSILIKIGVKCENHSCTIEFMDIFLKKHFDSNDVKFLKMSMESRINAQYYVDRKINDENYNHMQKNAPEFSIKCKEILFNINDKEINDIRNKLKIMIK